MRLRKVKVDLSVAKEAEEWLLEQEDVQNEIRDYQIRSMWKPNRGEFWFFSTEVAVMCKMMFHGVMDD